MAIKGRAPEELAKEFEEAKAEGLTPIQHSIKKSLARSGAPWTRENYIARARLGGPDDSPWTEDDEADLPPEFQRQ